MPSNGNGLQQELVSQIAANRKQFFGLIEALEKASSCNLSPELLEGAIDSDYSGRDSVTESEAREIITECSVKHHDPQPA